MCNVYLNTKDNKKYVVYWVNPPKYLGSWYEAHPLEGGKTIKMGYDKFKSDFEIINTRDQYSTEIYNRSFPIC